MVESLSTVLESIKKFMPCEFTRKPRTLKELSLWKATEFRSFLLFVGPMILRDFIPENYYNHFLKFHAAIRILLTPSVCQINNNIARDFLNEYVHESISLFYEKFATFNVHNLCHLADDALKYGHLDRISAFPFENRLGQIKKLLRKPGKSLAQTVRRITEIDINEIIDKPSNSPGTPILTQQHSIGPMLAHIKGDQFNHMVLSGWILTTRQPNNCIILQDKRILLIKNIVK